MNRLSSPIENIKNHYRVVVVGSGYGGGIAASRLARAGQQVCVLERGKEIQPGEYPDNELEALGEMQLDLPQKHLGSRTGLYDFHVNKDINVLVGCGLGGTSLLNASVSLRAEPRIFEDFPQAFRDDINTLLHQGYVRAEQMLRPIPYPQNFPSLRKLDALLKSAEYLNEKFYRPPINVTFQDGVNHVGVEQKACNLCGDCVSGCNNQAKNTVLMNYLPDAKNYGAEIYTQVSVRWIEREGNHWLVHYQILDSGREKFNAPTLFVSADIVILAAGTLGSTEILLRSAADNLAVSQQLGQHMSGNGDVMAFGYNNDVPINGIGFGSQTESVEPVGPCITGIIDMREQPQLDNSMVIEEGSMPGAIASILPAALAGAAQLMGEDTDKGFPDKVKEKQRELSSLIYGAYTGAVRNTQTYLVMTHDNANGRMYLEEDRLRIDWDGVGKEPVFERVHDRIEQATRPLGGTKLPNPLWSNLFEKDLITVHPLGGCIMAENGEHGVVNHKGQVFTGDTTAVHKGLYVCDGSVIPCSLGVNPLLTISAIAERCCALIAEDYNWTINYDLPSTPLRVARKQRPGIQFTETMRGYWQPGIEKSPFEFTLTITSDDLEEMLNNENHQARMVGTVIAPMLSAQPLTVTYGEFNLFIIDPDEVGIRRILYRMKMTAEDGKVYYLDGYKLIHDQPGFDLWADTTTLYITIHDGNSIRTPVLGQGILNIQPTDFMRQISTLRVTNTNNLQQRLELTARFGHFFAGALFDTYSEIFAKPVIFNPDAPPRKKRQLRVCAPEVYFFETSDSVQLKLTRYKGGTKPVMLVHGLGVSSLIFAIDTIETNLLEYLYAYGYDVWLLDYRSSIELPASHTNYTGDDVALYDYPAAVDKIREITGAETIQAVVHCFGATTFFMAMLAGLQGVSSVVCSQVATHSKVPFMTQLKSGLYIPSLLENLGINSLTAYVDSHADWLNELFDKALRLYPVDAGVADTSPVSRRISFLYGQLYQLDQLNTATYNSLHEMFGLANINTFEHLALIVRKGHIVNANGEDIYLPHLERLAIPITFIHGVENNCWLPESTEMTYNLLQEKNGNIYTRHVIPNYGHLDCIFGKNAAKDVYPLILKHLQNSLG
jgi:cholesterol oxidase